MLHKYKEFIRKNKIIKYLLYGGDKLNNNTVILGLSEVGKSSIKKYPDKNEIISSTSNKQEKILNINIATLFSSKINCEDVTDTLKRKLNLQSIPKNIENVIFICDRFTVFISRLFSYLKMKLTKWTSRKLKFIIIRNKIDRNSFLPEELENLTQYALVHKLIFIPINAQNQTDLECLNSFLYRILVKENELSVNNVKEISILSSLTIINDDYTKLTRNSKISS